MKPIEVTVDAIVTIVIFPFFRYALLAIIGPDNMKEHDVTLGDDKKILAGEEIISPIQ